MATNLAIDDKLIEAARKHKTKRAVVIEALEEYIQRRKQIQIINLFGTIDYNENYNYKAQKKKYECLK